MHNMIHKVLKHHEDHMPHHKKLNDMAYDDLVDASGVVQPARGLALNTSYFLDKGTHRRPHHHDKFDRKLSKEEKKILGEEAFGLSELASMLYHPGFILDRSGDHALSDNRRDAREMLEHLIDVYQERAAEVAMEELVAPMHEMLRDEMFDESKALNALLPYIMTEETEHDPEMYKKYLMSHFILPMLQGHHHGHWKNGLQEYLDVKDML